MTQGLFILKEKNRERQQSESGNTFRLRAVAFAEQRERKKRKKKREQTFTLLMDVRLYAEDVDAMHKAFRCHGNSLSCSLLLHTEPR